MMKYVFFEKFYVGSESMNTQRCWQIKETGSHVFREKLWFIFPIYYNGFISVTAIIH